MPQDHDGLVRLNQGLADWVASLDDESREALRRAMGTSDRRRRLLAEAAELWMTGEAEGIWCEAHKARYPNRWEGKLPKGEEVIQ